VRTDEKLTAFLQLQRAIHEFAAVRQFRIGGEPWLRYPHALSNPMP
jgi:hypothetical protein